MFINAIKIWIERRLGHNPVGRIGCKWFHWMLSKCFYKCYWWVGPFLSYHRKLGSNLPSIQVTLHRRTIHHEGWYETLHHITIHHEGWYETLHHITIHHEGWYETLHHVTIHHEGWCETLHHITIHHEGWRETLHHITT